MLSPSLNYGRFLGDALQSVALQHGTEAEHVIADGGSTDETLDVLRRTPASVSWRSEPDRGQSDALNKALSMASGDWVGWLNVDEFYLPWAFDALSECLTRHPDADLVHGDAVFVDVDGNVLRLVAQHSLSPRVLRWERCNISSCAMFVRRDAIPDRPWDPELRVAMDWDFYLGLLARERKFVYIPSPLAAFRVHLGQVSAAPLSYDGTERRLLRERYSLPDGALGRLALRAGRLEHRLLKVVSGGWRRERRTSALAGADIRWFASDRAFANAVSVLAASAPLLPRLPERRAVCRYSPRRPPSWATTRPPGNDYEGGRTVGVPVDEPVEQQGEP